MRSIDLKLIFKTHKNLKQNQIFNKSLSAKICIISQIFEVECLFYSYNSMDKFNWPVCILFTRLIFRIKAVVLNRLWRIGNFLSSYASSWSFIRACVTCKKYTVIASSVFKHPWNCRGVWVCTCVFVYMCIFALFLMRQYNVPFVI